MDHMDTDLKKLIQMNMGSGITEEHIIILMYNILCSIKFMHSCNVVHRNICPSNILVNKNCQVMLCDFEMARTLPQSVVCNE